jgi:hypothetical protein
MSLYAEKYLEEFPKFCYSVAYFHNAFNFVNMRVKGENWHYEIKRGKKNFFDKSMYYIKSAEGRNP